LNEDLIKKRVIFIFDDGNERPVKIALYMIENNSTVRKAAKVFGISKSTVHKDITVKLKQFGAGNNVYNEVMRLLETNKKERHIRGGEATKKKYMDMKAEDKNRTKKGKIYKKGLTKTENVVI